MSRKVHVNVTTRLILTLDDGIDVDSVISELDYNFTSGTDGADVEDTEIVDHEVTDSK